MARNVGASGGNCEPREMITPDSDHGKKMKTRAMENSVQVESRIPLRLDPKKQTIALLRLINWCQIPCIEVHLWRQLAITLSI